MRKRAAPNTARSNIERKVSAVVIATGIASVVTQLSTIREFLSYLEGNEFVIALILFNWLFLSGLGTFLATPFSAGATPGKLHGISLILAALSPVQILIIRKIHDLVFLSGASPGFYPSFIYVLLTTAPYCLVLGFVLPYSLMVIKNRIPEFSGTRIYIVDNIGDITGGVLFSFVLVYLCTPFQAILIAHLPLLIALYHLRKLHPDWKLLKFWGLATALTILILALFLESASLVPAAGKMVHYQETPYGRIQLFQDREQYTLFQNGRPMFSSHDLITAEEAVHYPLSQMDAPRRVLLVSPESLMIQELLKYRPESIDCLEIDPAITGVQFRFGLLKKRPEMHMIHEDARRYLTRTAASYDAIILNLPEPDTFQINRFFTDEFFVLAHKRLNPGGVLSFSVKGVDNYPSQTEALKISTIFHTVGRSFSHVLMMPGSRLYFICSDHSLSVDIDRRLMERNIPTAYISGYYAGNITPQRIHDLRRHIDFETPVNRDFSPNLVRILQAEWFARFETSPVMFGLILTLLNLIYLSAVSKEEFVLYSTGCFVMGAEILVIFAFQIFFGYVYLKIGWIITIFLAGLLPGALFGERLRNHGKPLLLATDGGLMTMMAVFMAAVGLFSSRLFPETAFLIFGFTVSALCGFQFPVALHLRGGGKAAAVRVFSADLMGAAAGTIITSTVLVPWVGILGAAAALLALKSISMIILWRSHGTTFPKKIPL